VSVLLTGMVFHCRLQPTVSTIGKYATTDERRIPLLIDFGERLLQLNPLRLFSVTGFSR
jgi:hypothetical protein